MGAMDHSEVREILEDAAVEPQGLERLMAGDTPNGALVAGHLAACPDCAEEMARLHRAVGVIRPVIRTVAPPELRQRTLAYVAAVGRPRGAPADPLRSAGPGAAPRGSRGRRRPALGLFVGLSAALIVAVAATGLIVSAGRDETARQQAAEIAALGEVARWTLQIEGQSDVRRVALASTSGASTTGRLVFSPSSTELVVVANDLAPPPAGREYRCWIEIEGRRTGIGRMYFGGDLAYWVGDAEEIAGIDTPVRFGVSLVDPSRTDIPGEPVLVGAG